MSQMLKATYEKVMTHFKIICSPEETVYAELLGLLQPIKLLAKVKQNFR